MRLVITYNKPGLTPGVRVQRASDGKWLDPATLGWRDTVPLALISTRPLGGEFDSADRVAGAASPPYPDVYVVDLPIDGTPDTYTMLTHGPEALGYPRIDVPQVIQVLALAYEGYLSLPIQFRAAVRP